MFFFRAFISFALLASFPTDQSVAAKSDLADLEVDTALFLIKHHDDLSNRFLHVTDCATCLLFYAEGHGKMSLKLTPNSILYH